MIDHSQGFVRVDVELRACQALLVLSEDAIIIGNHDMIVQDEVQDFGWWTFGTQQTTDQYIGIQNNSWHQRFRSARVFLMSVLTSFRVILSKPSRRDWLRIERAAIWARRRDTINKMS